MKKIILAIMAIFVLAIAGAVSAVPMTMVSGEVLDAENNPVIGVSVDVTCTHNGTDTTKNVVTDDLGEYYAFFGSDECNTGDAVIAQTEGSEDQEGIVSYDNDCRVNTLKLNLQIPEFGVIAGAVALVAGLGIIAYRRK
ncbi:MAG: carboxypeptidase-like regulatory domain-containing protein [Candidatus Woesearchaeota archaeon]